MAALVQGCNPLTSAVVAAARTKRRFVITTDFVTGLFATIEIKGDRDVTPASAARNVNSDAVSGIRRPRYVINRMGDESIQVLDPDDDYATLSRCSTGVGTNPHDIAIVDDDKAYVTLFNKTDLLIVDPSIDEDEDCGDFILGRIDLSVFADADGIPEMDQMAIIDDRLYVSIEHLDRDNFFTPTGLGQIAVIDIDSDSVIGEIALGAPNPFGATKGLTIDNDDLIVSLTGQFGVADGGIQRVDARNQGARAVHHYRSGAGWGRHRFRAGLQPRRLCRDLEVGLHQCGGGVRSG